MKTRRIQLTVRDIEILRFINEFGFCEIEHVKKQFNLSVPRVYQLIKRLITTGLVKSERIFYGRPGVLSLTNEGAKHSDLCHIEKIPMSHYNHHLTVIFLYQKLLRAYPEATWVSERRLINDKFSDGVGQRGHIADGMLVFPDGRQIAIEVELTLKGKTRIEKILKGYAAQFGIAEVWYYCNPKLISILSTLITKMPFIKLFDLPEFLYAE